MVGLSGLTDLPFSGRSPFVYVWEFESQTILRIIELPSPINRVISVRALLLLLAWIWIVISFCL